MFANMHITREEGFRQKFLVYSKFQMQGILLNDRRKCIKEVQEYLIDSFPIKFFDKEKDKIFHQAIIKFDSLYNE